MKSIVKATMIGLTVLFLSITVKTTPANAVTDSYNLDLIVSADTYPLVVDSTKPYLLVTIQDISGGVSITVNATNLVSGQFVSALYMNEPNVTLASGNFSGAGSDFTFCYPVSNSCKADGDGSFNVVVGKAGDHLVNAGSSLTFTILASGLDTTDFHFMSTGSSGACPGCGGGNGTYSMIAHIQGIPTNCSAWVGSDDNATGTSGGNHTPSVTTSSCVPTTVPEASSLILFGSGLVLLCVIVRRFHLV